MNVQVPLARASPKRLTAAIFDVDGVLLASPHEQAWREALEGIVDPNNFTTAMYQASSLSDWGRCCERGWGPKGFATVQGVISC